MKFSIRQFGPHEVATYKTIRLEALRLEPGFFGNSFEMEQGFEDAVWQGRLSDPYSACFGLYADDALMGLTSIFGDAAQPEDAYMTQSYIRKEFRGRGLSRMLYDARIAWAHECNIRRLRIGHRLSNAASMQANQHYGFRHSHNAPRLWPDGTEEEMVYYTLELS